MKIISSKLGEIYNQLFLGGVLFFGLKVYAPNYRPMYCMSKVQRL